MQIFLHLNTKFWMNSIELSTLQAGPDFTDDLRIMQDYAEKIQTYIHDIAVMIVNQIKIYGLIDRQIWSWKLIGWQMVIPGLIDRNIAISRLVDSTKFKSPGCFPIPFSKFIGFAFIQTFLSLFLNLTVISSPRRFIFP